MLTFTEFVTTRLVDDVAARRLTRSRAWELLSILVDIDPLQHLAAAQDMRRVCAERWGNHPDYDLDWHPRNYTKAA